MESTPPSEGSKQPRPRWVKVSVAIAAAVVLVFVVLLVTGAGGEHGPGQHVDGDEPGVNMPEGHRPPGGARP